MQAGPAVDLVADHSDARIGRIGWAQSLAISEELGDYAVDPGQIAAHGAAFRPHSAAWCATARVECAPAGRCGTGQLWAAERLEEGAGERRGGIHQSARPWILICVDTLARLGPYEPSSAAGAIGRGGNTARADGRANVANRADGIVKGVVKPTLASNGDAGCQPDGHGAEDEGRVGGRVKAGGRGPDARTRGAPASTSPVAVMGWPFSQLGRTAVRSRCARRRSR